MEKKKSLTAALAKTLAEEPAGEPSDPGAPARRIPQQLWPRPDRAGKTNITGYFEKSVKWELQDLATERSRSLGRKITAQELLSEALNDLFKKYGKPEIATLGKKRA